MKKTIFAIACALFLGQSMVAQNEEVVLVEDPTQGVVVNSFKDNWFLGVEGGIRLPGQPSWPQCRLQGSYRS